jgi:hypothetical protein
MTTEDIIRLTRQVGGSAFDHTVVFTYEEVRRFMDLVAAAEREECAQVCEELRDDWLRGRGRYEFMGEGADYCADAIRARGNK